VLVPFIVPRAARRAALTFLVASSAVACAKDRPASTPASPPSAAAPGAPAPDPVGLVPLPEDKATTALQTYRITLPQIQRWGKAQSAINAVMKEHPEIVREMQRTPPHTLDAMIALLDAQPRIRGALKQSGETATDFVLTMAATNEAVQGYRRKLSTNALPPDLPPALAANIAVVEQNLSAINQVYAAIAKP
jgi:hypothetical protein